MIYRNQYIERKEVISKTILKICIRKHRRTKNQPEIKFKGDSQKGKRMKLIDLIEKLKTKNGETGTWALLKDWIKKMSKAKYYSEKNEFYNKICGFIWGLEATGYITHNEFIKLQEELIDEYSKITVLID